MARKKLPKLNKKKIAALSDDMANSEQSEADSTPVVGVVNASGGQWHKLWKLGLAVLVVLALVVVGYYLSRPEAPAVTGPKYKTIADSPELLVSTTYRVLGKQGTQDRLKSDIGVDMAAIESQSITAEDFKKFDEAYIVAQAYLGLDDIDRALQAFAAAEKLAKGKEANYGFYLAYASAFRLKTTDKNGHIPLLKKAKQALEADTSWAPEEKAYELKDINYQIDPANNPVPET